MNQKDRLVENTMLALQGKLVEGKEDIDGRELAKREAQTFKELAGKPNLKFTSKVDTDIKNNTQSYYYTAHISDLYIEGVKVDNILKQMNYIKTRSDCPNHQFYYNYIAEWGVNKDNKNLTYQIGYIYNNDDHDTLSFICTEPLNSETDIVASYISNVHQRLLDETGVDFRINTGTPYPTLFDSDNTGVTLHFKGIRSGKPQIKYPYYGWCNNIDKIINLFKYDLEHNKRYV